MSEERSLYVARPDDLAALQGHWTAAKEGKPTFVRVQSGFGGGRRALTSAFLRDVHAGEDEPLIWRVSSLDQENGIQWLVRMYGSLVAAVTSNVLLRGKVEMILNGQLPNQTKRVQSWYEQFIAGMKEAKRDDKSGNVSLKIPKDNPVIGLVEVVRGISRKLPIILDLQAPYAVNSLLAAQFLEGLLDECLEVDSKVLVLLHDEPDSDITRSTHPLALLDFYDRRKEQLQTVELGTWSTDDVQAYLDSKGLKGNAARIGEIAEGRPGFIAELVDIFEADGTLDSDLADITLASMVPGDVDTDDLEVPDKAKGKDERKHATPDDAARITHFAALLGQAFPSALVADMGGFDHESVDDLIDAMSDLFEEVQFLDDMNTWIYKFKRGAWREGVLAQHKTDEGQDMARRVGLFMERYLVPRGYGYIAKTSRIYAENGAPGRAAQMRSVGLTNDAPDAWALAHDFMKYFDEIKYPDPLRRTVYTSFLDRLVGGGSIQAAETVHAEASEWAQAKEDRDLQAWLLFNGSKLDARRQDFFRSRERANDAIKMYASLDAKLRQAEVYTHLATIELQDGKAEAALKAIDQAVELGEVQRPDGEKGLMPNVQAHAEFVRGVVARRANQLDEAVVHFKRANEIAGNTGIAGLALDSGLSLGEALYASRQLERAREVLGRVVGLCRQLNNLPRERAAAELLAQACGALKKFDEACELSKRVLQLSQQLKFERAIPVDLYNVAFFTFAQNKPADAKPLFAQAAKMLGTNSGHPLEGEVHYYLGMTALQTDAMDEARPAFKHAVERFTANRDPRKAVAAMTHLATVEEKSGNASSARGLLDNALKIAEEAELKEERKVIRKRLEALV